MSTVPFSAVDALYTLGEERSIHYYRAEHELFRDFCRSSRALQHRLGEEANDPVWVDLIRSLRRYRFVMSAAPLPFNDPGAEPRVGGAAMQSMVNRLAAAYPDVISVARATVNLCLRLRQCADNPLLDCIDSLFGREIGPIGVLVPDSRLMEPTGAALKMRDGSSHFEVVGIQGARGRATYARLIVVGPASWYPDYVFRAPRARLLEVVAYRWNRIRWQPERTFLGSDDGFAIIEGSGPDLDDEAETEEPWPETDWSQIAHLGVEPTGAALDWPDHEMAVAHLFILHGGNAVFLDGSEGSHCLAIDPREHATERVKRVATRSLDPGMYVLLRTEGGGDYIAPIADKILGEAAVAHRAAQKYWKRLLRGHMLRTDLFKTCIRLLELGSSRANETNLRNWMSERTIGTERYDDFQAIMRLIGLDRESDHYWKITRQIKAAHLQAGIVIRRRLIQRVMEADIGDMEKRGTLVFELPEAEGGKLTAFRVENRAPSVISVPAARLDRVFTRED